MCLGSAACITHKAQALTSHAATWHACATINPYDPSMVADAEADAAAVPPVAPTTFNNVPTQTTAAPSVASSSPSPSVVTPPVPTQATIGTVHWAPEFTVLSVGDSETTRDASSRSICTNSSNSSNRREIDDYSDEDDEWALDIDKLMITHTTISYQKRQAIGKAFSFSIIIESRL
jgi:Protein of unknown function (DUF3537)